MRIVPWQLGAAKTVGIASSLRGDGVRFEYTLHYEVDELSNESEYALFEDDNSLSSDLVSHFSFLVLVFLFELCTSFI